MGFLMLVNKFSYYSIVITAIIIIFDNQITVCLIIL